MSSTTRAFQLLRTVHARPGLTRAAAARLIGVGSGATADLVSRLAAAGLIGERPASPSGSRGRPTTVLGPHPAGPLVAAASITHESWRVDVVELGGSRLMTAAGEHDGEDGDAVVARVREVVDGFCERLPGRVRGLGIAAPGPVTPAGRLDAAHLDWHDIDLGAAWSGSRPDATDDDPVGSVFVAGNDATLAAAAESARGAAVGSSVALHLHVLAGLGGAVVHGGRVLPGATGTGGEFGHMPFGDPAVRCPCGALGCWGTAVDGSALARSLGHDPPRDLIAYGRRVIGLAAAGDDPGASRAVDEVAAALGRGVAGLVNALDPDLVTLGGVAVDLLHTAPGGVDAAYRAGLMRVRRYAPPPVVAAALGEDGPIAGAAEEAWSLLLARLPV